MNIVLLLSTETETTAAEHCPCGKRLKRTNLTACAMRDAPLAHRQILPRSPTRYAQKINSNFYIPQYVAFVNIIKLYIEYFK